MPSVYVSNEELDYLHKLLSSQQNANAQSILESVEEEIDFYRKKQVPALTEEAVRFLRDTLLDYVINRKPADLSKSHTGEWFMKSAKGCQWNWRSRAYPVFLLAKKLGYDMEAYNNTPEHVKYNIVNSVVRSKKVLPTKERAAA